MFFINNQQYWRNLWSLFLSDPVKTLTGFSIQLWWTLSYTVFVVSSTHLSCLLPNKVILTLRYVILFSRGNGQEWRPCIVDVLRKHCDVDHPAFWQTIHTLRITEANGLGSETTTVRFKLHELCKITYNTLTHMGNDKNSFFFIFVTNWYG